jgi:hypothetical protein
MLKQLYRQQWPYVANRSRALRAGITLKLADLNGSGSRASYMKQYEFEQAARQKAQLAAADSQTIETIRDEILAKSHDLGLWVAREGIAIASSRKDALIPIAGVAAIVTNDNQSDLPRVGSVNIDLSYDSSHRVPSLYLPLEIPRDDHTIWQCAELCLKTRRYASQQECPVTS